MSIKESWSGFERSVIPSDASDTQRRDMRMAYLAGFYSALMALDSLSEDDIPEDKAVNMLQDLHNECAELIREFKDIDEG